MHVNNAPIFVKYETSQSDDDEKFKLIHVLKRYIPKFLLIYTKILMFFHVGI